MAGPADLTRQKIIAAATELFAEHGYRGAGVRAIIAKAGVNQAAVNYHFKGKDGLYLEVLKACFDAYTEHGALDPEALRALPREEALRHFLRQQLHPLLLKGEMSHFARLMAWEEVSPSGLLQEFLRTQAAPYFALGVELVRRFLPRTASDEEASLAAVWLLGQCSVFHRRREQLEAPPFAMTIDEAFVSRLSDLVARLALYGLGAAARRPP